MPSHTALHLFVSAIIQMSQLQAMVPAVQAGSTKALARLISLVENQAEGVLAMLEQLPASQVPVVGITGPPGAGKSTLVDGLIQHWVQAGKKVGVLCVDPSSPFNLGALLGDRIRMSEWYDHPQVYIRSLATRGSLGGLHPYILEITDVMKQAGFDYIVVETVGVGQSEVEIAGLADCTVVVVVPEAGDEIQTMKAGLMEIADVFVVNKADRPDADRFVHNLRLMLAPAFSKKQQAIPVVKTVAQHREGIDGLATAIDTVLAQHHQNDRHLWLLTEKLWHLLQQQRMRHLSKQQLKDLISAEGPAVNVYRLLQRLQ